MVNNCGIILSFDDTHVNEWFALKDFFKSNKIKATFYPIISTLEKEDWEKLRELQFEGHIVGHHGFNHLRAGEIDMDIDDARRKDKIKYYGQTGWINFLNNEINAGLNEMRKNEINCNHYAYPYGNRNENSDLILLKIFKTLRGGDLQNYNLNETPRVIYSVDFGKNPLSRYSGHEQSIIRTLQSNKIICLHSHIPIIMSRLSWLVEIINSFGGEFFTPEVIKI